MDMIYQHAPGPFRLTLTDESGKEVASHPIHADRETPRDKMETYVRCAARILTMSFVKNG